MKIPSFAAITAALTGCGDTLPNAEKGRMIRIEAACSQSHDTPNIFAITINGNGRINASIVCDGEGGV